jgi:hypothetical protein
LLVGWLVDELVDELVGWFNYIHLMIGKKWEEILRLID